MQRMTDALSRMLNDPSTRRAMRTLGDREDTATRERAQSDVQLEEDEEEPIDNDDTSESVINPERIESTSDNNNSQTSNEEAKTNQEMDESISEASKKVPDITIQGCSQNMDTNTTDNNISSHKDGDEAEKIENDENKDSDNGNVPTFLKNNSTVNENVSGINDSLQRSSDLESNNDLEDVTNSTQHSTNPSEVSSKQDDKDQKDITTGLNSHLISISDRHHQISSTTASLVAEAASGKERSTSETTFTENHVERDDTETETDSVMRRSIDSLHQSISNMRDEFLER